MQESSQAKLPTFRPISGVWKPPPAVRYMLLLLLLLQIVVIMIRYNTTIPSLSCTYKALISTTKSTMSIYLTSAPLETFPPSSTKPTLFFSRASPPNNFRACAAGSPAPQAEKFSLSVHLWVKLQATQVNLPHHAFQLSISMHVLTWSRTYLSCLCFITALSHCPALIVDEDLHPPAF